MKIALISDIHANLPAFSAVLTDIKRRGIRVIWNLGDTLGYGPFPRETLALLMRAFVKSIRGNYDDKVLMLPRNARMWKKTKSALKFFCFRWAYEHTPARQRAYLARLPRSFMEKVCGKNMYAVHGSSVSAEEALGPDTPSGRLRVLAGKTCADIICCGHSHMYFARTIQKKWFINPGSVGRPFDGDPRASYAIVTVSARNVSVRNIRVPYDFKKLRERMRLARFDPALIASIIGARSLDNCSVDVALSNGAVRAFAKKYHYEVSHAEEVTRSAVQLFDSLKPVHCLTRQERAYLEAAAILHDIGFFCGARAHHKKAFTIIRRDKSLGLPKKECILIGLIARYHRKTLPRLSHPVYSHLNGTDRALVSKLAAIVRVADGLDNSHTQSSCITRVKILDAQVEIFLKKGACASDCAAASKKGDLFERVFRRKLIIH